VETQLSATAVSLKELQNRLAIERQELLALREEMKQRSVKLEEVSISPWWVSLCLNVQHVCGKRLQAEAAMSRRELQLQNLFATVKDNESRLDLRSFEFQRHVRTAEASLEEQNVELEKRKRQLEVDTTLWRQNMDSLAKQQSEVVALEAHLRSQALDAARRQTEIASAEDVRVLDRPLDGKGMLSYGFVSCRSPSKLLGGS
jgi:hypothetical protein